MPATCKTASAADCSSRLALLGAWRRRWPAVVRWLVASCLAGLCGATSAAWAEAEPELDPRHPAAHLSAVDSPTGEPQASEVGYEFFGPLAVANQHPPNQLFLLPLPARASCLEQGRQAFALRLDLANHIIRERDSGVAVTFDFETLRAEADYTWGQHWGELSLRVPATYRSHGFLDGIIGNWHAFFGMRNSVRKDVPADLYDYTVITRAGPVFTDTGDTLGLGDITLSVKWPLCGGRECRKALAVRGAVKLPTGSPDQGLGSGALDCSIGLLAELQLSPHLRGYANLDYVLPGRPQWDNVDYQSVPVAVCAFEYRLDRLTTLGAQYRYARNILRFGSQEADKDGQEVAFGLTRRIAPDLVWSAGFNEDAAGMTAPDLHLFSYLAWEW